MIVRIGDIVVGGDPCVVVAELGLNHNGDLGTAIQMIDKAVWAGADMVKFQKRTIRTVFTDEYLQGPKESPFGTTMGEYKYGVELSEDDYGVIDAYCRSIYMPWFASCWDEEAVDMISRYNPPCYKVASASLTDDALLRHTRSKGQPIILSTGMSTMGEIQHAVDVLGEEDLVLMHCTSTYPSVPEELSLRCITTYQGMFNCPIGYSGHEYGIPTTVAAVALGASIVERHLTLDRNAWGSDQVASVEPVGFEILIRHIRGVESSLGDGRKVVYDSELPIRTKLRRIG